MTLGMGSISLGNTFMSPWTAGDIEIADSCHFGLQHAKACNYRCLWVSFRSELQQPHRTFKARSLSGCIAIRNFTCQHIACAQPPVTNHALSASKNLLGRLRNFYEVFLSGPMSARKCRH